LPEQSTNQTPEQKPTEQPTQTPISEPVRLSIAEALDKIAFYEAKNKELETTLKKTTDERDQANSVLDGQVRANYLAKLRGISNLPEQKLVAMPTNQLETLLKSAEVLKHNNPKSIIFGNDDASGNYDPLDLYKEHMEKRRQR
jgi:hypothetical protein